MQLLINISKKYTAHYSGLSKECWQSVALTFIESLASGICFFLSLYFVNVLHISIATAGFLVSSYGVGTIIGGYATGKLSDKYPAKILSTSSLFMQSIAFYLFTQFADETSLLMNMFVVGFCTYGFMTSNSIWMLQQCQNKMEMRLKSINISRAASNLGMGVSGIIIGFVDVHQFHALFYFSSIVLLFSTLYFHFLVKDNTSLSFSEFNAHKEPDSNAHHQYDDQHSHQHGMKILFIMLNCIFLIGLIISQLSITYPVYIQRLFPHMGTSAVSILFILDTLLIVLFQAPLVNGLKDNNKIILVGLGAFLMGSGMFILNLPLLFYGAVVSCVIWTTGEMIFVGMAQFVCYEAGAAKNKGRTIGMVQATSAAGKIVGPILGGFVYYQFGGEILWGISMMIGIYCFLLCLYFRKYDFINC